MHIMNLTQNGSCTTVINQTKNEGGDIVRQKWLCT